MVKRRSETERSTDRSIDRTSGRRTPTGSTPPRLPRTPEAGGGAAMPKPPRLPDVPAARPGRRSEAPSDIVLTHRIERITGEPTPPPLPPAPAAADAERWFEQVPTNPGAPTTPPPRNVTGRQPLIEPLAAQAQRGAPAWLFPLLLALTALTVGMVIGALVFGRASAGTCAPCAADAGVSR
jgi:hypothetical protein